MATTRSKFPRLYDPANYPEEADWHALPEPAQTGPRWNQLGVFDLLMVVALFLGFSAVNVFAFLLIASQTNVR